jgi:hypothetical protein
MAATVATPLAVSPPLPMSRYGGGLAIYESQVNAAPVHGCRLKRTHLII